MDLNMLEFVSSKYERVSASSQYSVEGYCDSSPYMLYVAIANLGSAPSGGSGVHLRSGYLTQPDVCDLVAHIALVTEDEKLRRWMDSECWIDLRRVQGNPCYPALMTTRAVGQTYSLPKVSARET